MSRIEKNLEVIQDRVTKSDEYLASHLDDSALSGALSMIKERLDKLSGNVSEYLKLKIECESLSHAEEQCKLKLKESQSEESARNNAYIEADKRYKSYIESEPQSVDDLYLTQKHDHIANLEKTVQKISVIERIIGDIYKSISEIESLKTESSKKSVLLDKITSESNEITEKIDLNNRLLAELKENQSLYAQIITLNSERKKLRDGVACSLCGSVHHPYCDDPNSLPVLSKSDSEILITDKKIEETEKALNTLNLSLSKKNSEHSSITTSLTMLSENQRKAEFELINQRRDLITAAKDCGYEGSLDLEENLGVPESLVGLVSYLESRKEKLSLEKEELQSAKEKYETARKLKRAAESENEALKTIRENLSKLSADYKIACNNSLNATQNYQRASSEIADGIAGLKTLPYFAAVAENYPLRIDEGSKFDLKAYYFVLDELKVRNEKYARTLVEKENDNNKLHTLTSEQCVLNSQIQSLCNEKTVLSAKSAEIRTKLDEVIRKRVECYGEKNPAEEVELREKSSAELLDKISACNAEISTKEALINKLNEDISEFEKEATRYSSQATSADMTFTFKMDKAGFNTEDEYLDSKMDQIEAKQIDDRYLDLSNSLTKNSISISGLQERIDSIESMLPYDFNSDSVKALLESDKIDLNNVTEHVGALELSLRNNTELSVKYAEKYSEVEKQKKVTAKWDALNKLIGSSDGKKFRNFAQSLTFDALIANANHQLESMSDRYVLVQSTENALDLLIIDNYQGGIVRTVKNLSGGESFIISLALALGLSKMASRRVRVDSLFLDEGFGTLDSEFLETALGTLLSLREEGKLIGVISHVSDVSERIPTQIQIQKKSGGRCQINGAGVKCLKSA